MNRFSIFYTIKTLPRFHKPAARYHKHEGKENVKMDMVKQMFESLYLEFLFSKFFRFECLI